MDRLHPQRKIFSNAVLEQVFDSDLQANGIAKLIGRLMYLTDHDPNDVNVFYRRYTEFYAKHKVMVIKWNSSNQFVVGG